MTGYTIKSESKDGEFFLAKNWRKNKALWVKKDWLKEQHLYKTYGHCEQALYNLLDTMPEYKSDTFYMVFIDGELSTESKLTLMPKLFRKREARVI